MSSIGGISDAASTMSLLLSESGQRVATSKNDTMATSKELALAMMKHASDANAATAKANMEIFDKLSAQGVLMHNDLQEKEDIMRESAQKAARPTSLIGFSAPPTPNKLQFHASPHEFSSPARPPPSSTFSAFGTSPAFFAPTLTSPVGDGLNIQTTTEGRVFGALGPLPKVDPATGL
jgi:hypothetical protein